MTLVIATRGIDLSVGAVMAVSGAVDPDHHRRLVRPGQRRHRARGDRPPASGWPCASGIWNGFLVAVLGIQPIIATLVLMMAGRGVALLITGGFITTVNSAPLKYVAQRIPRSGSRSRSSSAVVAIAVVGRWSSVGPRSAC